MSIENSKIIEAMEVVGWSWHVAEKENAEKTGKRTPEKSLSLSHPDSMYLPNALW